jgi:hypothetical protein
MSLEHSQHLSFNVGFISKEIKGNESVSRSTSPQSHPPMWEQEKDTIFFSYREKGDTIREENQTKINSKCIREWFGNIKMVVGKDVFVVKVARYFSQTFFCEISGKLVGEASLRRCLEHNLKPFSMDVIESHVLVRGWMCFTARSKDDYSVILGRTWS